LVQANVLRVVCVPRHAKGRVEALIIAIFVMIVNVQFVILMTNVIRAQRIQQLTPMCVNAILIGVESV